MSIKVFNSLPNWIADLVQRKKICIGNLKSVLMEDILFSKLFSRLLWKAMTKLNVYVG